MSSQTFKLRCRSRYLMPGLGAFYCDLDKGHNGWHHGTSADGNKGKWPKKSTELSGSDSSGKSFSEDEDDKR
jgi:hypothetical protein